MCLSKYFIVWPDRGVLKDSIPLSFRNNFPNYIVIIDCFEVFIDMYADLLDRASTYSSYKAVQPLPTHLLTMPHSDNLFGTKIQKR